MSEQELINNLKAEGYDNIYVWDAEPGEEDTLHIHAFDTKLVILDGWIEVGVGSSKKLLAKGDELEVPREKPHEAAVGNAGCKYIVAEKH